MREEEPFLRPSDPDVGQPAFLFQLVRVIAFALGGQGPGVREDSLIQAADEDGAELEPLGGMKRDERDSVGVALVAVLVRHEGRLLEQPVQGVVR